MSAALNGLASPTPSDPDTRHSPPGRVNDFETT